MPGKKRGERLFVALDPPREVKAAVAVWGREAARTGRGMRPVDAEKTHITLAFLGYRNPNEAGVITEAMARVAAPAGELGLGEPLWLPKRRPRSLAIAVNRDSGELDEIRTALVAELASAIGWEPERRAFLPHLTAVRMGRGFEMGSDPLPPTPQLNFTGESLTLYRSTLDSAGVRYEVLAREALSG